MSLQSSRIYKMRNCFERLNNWFNFEYSKRKNNNNNSDRYNLFKTYDDTLKIIKFLLK